MLRIINICILTDPLALDHLQDQVIRFMYILTGIGIPFLAISAVIVKRYRKAVGISCSKCRILGYCITVNICNFGTVYIPAVKGLARVIDHCDAAFGTAEPAVFYNKYSRLRLFNTASQIFIVVINVSVTGIKCNCLIRTFPAGIISCICINGKLKISRIITCRRYELCAGLIGIPSLELIMLVSVLGIGNIGFGFLAVCSADGLNLHFGVKGLIITEIAVVARI